MRGMALEICGPSLTDRDERLSGPLLLLLLGRGLAYPSSRSSRNMASNPRFASGRGSSQEVTLDHVVAAHLVHRGRIRTGRGPTLRAAYAQSLRGEPAGGVAETPWEREPQPGRSLRTAATARHPESRLTSTRRPSTCTRTIL